MKEPKTYQFLKVIALALFLVVSSAGSVLSAENPEEKDLIVYVDENSAQLVITNHVDSSYIIQLFDLTGKEVMKLLQDRDNPTRRIETSQLHRGIYLVRVIPAEKATSKTVKVMIR
ncbi:T9SS type A sorting domain-containing protein [Geofilum rubicundum]|uniref:Secretion system C-terminal sorting domain-containing protein n=1 Tax=Geofilum rubicundum JCM 15548 TaxID=1236989 RepID=A0A0E9M2H8_9BACT|nr:T9SS type A sorting domain-containing protein [Geofilum rubicundum]GAO31335.1 hypothetical protein JCM15548_13686 [Geofilum rubicundum JCM 15548]